MLPRPRLFPCLRLLLEFPRRRLRVLYLPGLPLEKCFGDSPNIDDDFRARLILNIYRHGALSRAIGRRSLIDLMSTSLENGKSLCRSASAINTSMEPSTVALILTGSLNLSAGLETSALRITPSLSGVHTSLPDRSLEACEFTGVRRLVRASQSAMRALNVTSISWLPYRASSPSAAVAITLGDSEPTAVKVTTVPLSLSPPGAISPTKTKD